MANTKEFKAKIKELITQDYKIEFLGSKFDVIAEMINETKSKEIYQWIKRIINKEIRPIKIVSKKKYKDWQINELMTFRHAFRINNSEYRILFVKLKNSFYLEFHLGNHKYYDKIRKELMVKDSIQIPI
ncbi:MAG: hypothetical protein U9R34_07155 [Nanoarchaeota archaeon]|nr:hypothetical protein [Nanoarchaeota archaeon]